LRGTTLVKNSAIQDLDIQPNRIIKACRNGLLSRQNSVGLQRMSITTSWSSRFSIAAGHPTLDWNILER